MVSNKNIRLTNKNLFQKNLEFINKFGYKTYLEGYFIAEHSTDADFLPISLHNELNDRLEIKEDITWFYDKNLWWVCEKGHVFTDKPSSFIEDQYYRRRRNKILYSNIICLICSAYDMSSPNILIFWDDINQKYYSSNKDIVFSRIVFTDKQIPYWVCDICETSIKILNRKNKLEKMQYKMEHLNYLLGICYFCNIGKLISGYNDVYSNFPHLSFRWDADKMPYSIYETIFNLEDNYIKYSFICPNGHKWENKLKNELSKFCCCGEPLLGDLYNAIKNMGLEKIFSEYSNGRKKLPTDEKGRPMLPKRPSIRPPIIKKDLDKINKLTLEKSSDIKNIFGSLDIPYSYTASWKEPPYKLNYENMFENLHVKYTWICSKNKDHIWKNTLYQRIKNPRCPKCIRWINESEFLELFNELTNFNFKNGKMSANWGKNKKIQIDILDDDANIAIDYDGYDAHSQNPRHRKTWKERIERDLKASKAVLNAPVNKGEPKYIMIRIREKDVKKGSLPKLLIKDNNYFEIEYESKSDKKIIIKKVLEKILEIRDNNGF